MAKADFYEVLGVTRDCDDKMLKAAFRKLAMQYHPDRNPHDKSAEHKFKEVNEAYEALKDPQKRAAYDRFGHAAFENGHGAGFNGDFAASMSNIFDDIFGDFMGGGARRGGNRSGRERGADLRYNMEISLEEAYAGKTAEIEVPTKIVCKTCSGTGAKRGSAPRVCPTCEGHGRVRSAQGFFSIERTCPTCQGRGEVISDPCPECSGAGRVTEERTLSVNIPAGIEDGTRIRLAGEGEAGLRGGPSGDLYIFLSIKPHEFFQRDGADIFCRVPISVTTAALGGEFQVPTIDGGKTAREGPRRHADRQAVPPQGQGHAGAPLEPDRRHVHPGRRRDAAQSVAPPARAARGVRAAPRRPRRIPNRPASSPACASSSAADLTPHLRPGNPAMPSEKTKGFSMADQLRFLKGLAARPRMTGAIAPSGPTLARADGKPRRSRRGPAGDRARPRHRRRHQGAPRARRQPVAADRHRVQSGFLPAAPRALSRHHRASRATPTISPARCPRAAPTASRRSSRACRSSRARRRTATRLIEAALDRMAPGRPYIQFSYMPHPPAEPVPGRFSAEASRWIWLNLPPARVWLYRRAAG